MPTAKRAPEYRLILAVMTASAIPSVTYPPRGQCGLAKWPGRAVVLALLLLQACSSDTVLMPEEPRAVAGGANGAAGGGSSAGAAGGDSSRQGQPGQPGQPSHVPAPELRLLLTDTVQAGGTVVLEGRNLPAGGAGIIATLGGVALSVTYVSSERLEMALPASGAAYSTANGAANGSTNGAANATANSFTCGPVTSVPLRISLPGAGTDPNSAASTVFQHDLPLRTARRLELSAGESVDVTGEAAQSCFEPVARGGGSARFVLAMVNTSGVDDTPLTQKTSAVLRGIGTGAQVATRGEPVPITGSASGVKTAGLVSSYMNGRSAEMATGTIGRTFAGASAGAISGSATDTTAHGDQLALQRSLAGTAGALRREWSSASRVARYASAAPARRVGDTLTINALLNSCSAGQPVRARVVYAGQKAMVLEDINAPRAGQMDASFRAIGTEFDNTVYPLLRRSVGDPLAMNAIMQGDGRVTMLFTRFVNDSAPGTAGYVSACNFHPRSVFAASNQDQVLYVRVPDMDETPLEWMRAMRSTVVHEAKHLASFAERLAAGVAFEEPWLEEATARVAEELYARQFPGGGAWRGNTGFAGSLGCELLQCDDRPLVMWRHFSQLYSYLQDTRSHSPFGATSPGDNSYYASGWSLVRFVLDRYAANEEASLRLLVGGAAGTGSGMNALAAVAGVSGRDMLTSWALANAGLYDAGSTARSPSWNTGSMWTGLSQLFAGAFDSEPLKGKGFNLNSAFSETFNLAAGGAGYVVLDADQHAAMRSALSLETLSGNRSPGAGISLVLVRVR